MFAESPAWISGFSGKPSAVFIGTETPPPLFEINARPSAVVIGRFQFPMSVVRLIQLVSEQPLCIAFRLMVSGGEIGPDTEWNRISRV